MPREATTVRLVPALAVLAASVAATWMIARHGGTPAPEPIPTATATPVEAVPTDVPTSPPSAVTPDPEYRLAGTVVGDRLYAIIESPDGSNELYGIGSEVPGLGTLVAVGKSHATFEKEEGRYDLPLLPVATPTPRAAGAPVAETRDDDTDYDDDYPDDEEAENGEYYEGY